MAASRYSVEIDLERAATSHALAVLNVAPESLVLDIGAADGSVARRLVERGCQVIGIELDPGSAHAAEQYCERVVVGDVETMDLAAALDGQSFEVVLLLDVLEHLRDPAATLKMAASLLKPRGRVIASIPNVTHAAMRLQLLSGRFPYTDTGLLDATHLHFFDRPSVERLFADAGLTVTERLRTTAGLMDTEIPIDRASFPEEVVALALSGEDADTYQFVYVASTVTTGSGTVSLGEALQGRIRELERVHAEAAEYARSLEAELAARDQVATQNAELAQRIEWLEEELGRRMAELERQHEDLRHAQMGLAVKDEQLAELHGKLGPARALEQLGSTRDVIVAVLKYLVTRSPRLYSRLKRTADWIERRRA